MYEILTKRGVRFDRLIKRPLQTSVDRLAAVEDTKMFPAAFERDFAGPHVKTYLRCSAQRLLVEDGVVKGDRVQPRDGSRSFIVRARKGVILATGGYQANPALRRHYQVDKTAMDIYPGLPTCRGDGHLLGQALGGDLVNMTMIPPIIAVASHLIESAIAVNISGCRFHDEAGPYLDPFYVDQMPGKRDSAATLEELAAKIGVQGDALRLSVQQWNNFLASGTDQEKGTGRVQFAPDRRGIIEAPFYSSPMISGVSLSVGGFVTTETMQVVDVFGQVIPGLFAVGDCAGGLTPTAEMGGTHLGGGFVLGWVAGRAAATGQNSLPHTSATFGQSMDQRVQMSGPIINVAAAQIKAKV
ncbi:hypothetical protein V501_00560 [Pseudogymnoascus sp. VKM F-4519 (FW-2642)]|nr:hypothetical protein V501_00560 [Pseudogymnoascus sp. VKM F-4519 (FW-2642)]